MSVIYLQDYNPWESIGELAGRYGGYRLGQIQNNRMAHGYQDMLNGGEQATPAQQMASQMPTQGQFNAGQFINNAMRNNSFGAQAVANNQGLWGGQNPAAPAQPMQANTDAPAAPVQPPQQNTGLWNFENLNNTGIGNGVPQTYQEMMQQRANNPFRGAPKLVENGSTNEDKAPGQYSIPDKATITSEARKRLGANTLALVKAGFDFKTAQGLANEQYQTDVNNMYMQQVNEYQEKVLEPMRQQIMNNLVFVKDKDGNPVVDTYNTKRVKGLAPAVARYNYLAGKVGAGTIDMNNLNSIAGGYGKVETKQFANGQVIVMTPDGQMKNIGNFGAKNIKVMPDGKTYIVGTDGSMKYVGTHVKPPTATQSGTSGYNAQVLRTLSAQHTAWVKANPDKDESESPYYGKLQGALSGAPTGGGAGTPTVKRQPTYSSEEQAAVAKRMNELSAQGWSDDQIAAELDAAGYGNYKSWLKSY